MKRENKEQPEERGGRKDIQRHPTNNDPANYVRAVPFFATHFLKSQPCRSRLRRDVSCITRILVRLGNCIKDIFVRWGNRANKFEGKKRSPPVSHNRITFLRARLRIIDKESEICHETNSSPSYRPQSLSLRFLHVFDPTRSHRSKDIPRRRFASSSPPQNTENEKFFFWLGILCIFFFRSFFPRHFLRPCGHTHASTFCQLPTF